VTVSFDCQECGACCVDYFGTAGYISLARDEPRRLRRLGLPVVSWHGQQLLGTRPHDGPVGKTCCVAFAGEVGKACTCTIYEDRPGECRRFEVGGPGCHFARREAGLPV
jgi:Fe-S-cluster containining protein